MLNAVQAFANKRVHVIVPLASVCSFVITLFVLLLVYDTVMPSQAPAKFTSPTLTIRLHKHGTEVEYSAFISADDDSLITTQRELINQRTNEVIILSAVDRKLERGTAHFTVMYGLPMRIAPDKWCMRSLIKWHPSFSIVHKAQEVSLGCAIPQEGV